MNEELSNAYWNGFSAGYDDLNENNPYDLNNQKELYDSWEKGFEDGSNNC